MLPVAGGIPGGVAWTVPFYATAPPEKKYSIIFCGGVN